MKRLILSAVCILLCTTGLWAQTLIDGIYYNLDASTQTASVTGGKKYSGNIIIPSSVNYNGTNFSVTSIGSDAFSNRKGLTSVTIPNSVTSIGSDAFYGCSGLTSITIPNSVTRIGSSAFSSCTGLSVTIPNSVTSIGSGAFYNVRHIIYTGSATGSPWGAIAVNGFVDGDFVFSDNTKTRLTAYIGNGGDVTIPSSVTSIGERAFYNCTGLTSVTIGDGVTSIGERAFYNCTGLTSVTIGDGVTSIGSYAFSYCTGLTSVTIPNSVTSIGSDAFYNVRHIIYTGSATGSPWGARTVNGFVDGDFVFSDNTKTRLTAYIGNGGDVTIPSSVTSIGERAFYNCTGLTSVTIPNSVTSIGSYAFLSCSGLTSVTIPNSVTSIGGAAFGYVKHIIYTGSATGSPWGAIAVNGFVDGDFVFSDNKKTRLTAYIGNGGDVTIPSSVTSIGERAFGGCKGLTSITIPNSVTSIGGDAFNDCTGLTSVTIGDGVTSIGEVAFYNCTGLTSVTIPNSVTSIGNNAFRNCTGLTSVTIPNSVTTIGSFAFSNCTGLTSITIPNSVTSIGDQAFSNCTGLTSITIPSSVTSIGSYAFSGCANLTSIIVPCGKYDYFVGMLTKYAAIIYENCTFEVVVNANNEDYGTVTGSGVFKMGQTIQLTATANEGYRFKGWSDGVMDASREITVTKDTSITANFVALYTIKALASASQGTVSGGGVYEDGETATLVANAKAGYTFAQWVDGNDENPRTVTVNGNKTYTAIFAIDEHNVTLSKNISAAGTVTGDGVYEHNTTVQLTATANEGYRFKGWSDGVTDASREIIVTKDTIITANFVALYTIKALASASQGTVIGGGVYEDGETVTLVANPNPGYIFAQWVDGSDENPRNVTVDGNKTYTAYFIEGESDATTAAPEAEESIVETARYDINGRPLTAPVKGVNIVKYSDGSFEKEFVK